jgi:hypothetical protein
MDMKRISKKRKSTLPALILILPDSNMSMARHAELQQAWKKYQKQGMDDKLMVLPHGTEVILTQRRSKPVPRFMVQRERPVSDK